MASDSEFESAPQEETKAAVPGWPARHTRRPTPPELPPLRPPKVTSWALGALAAPRPNLAPRQALRSAFRVSRSCLA